jgi:antitoxin component YwqK of YwqJK toxin-antitoxin module
MNKLLAALFVALLMVGCGSPDLDDKETLDEIIAEAIDIKRLQKRGNEGEELYHEPDQQKGYTGWVKNLFENGQVNGLALLKDGKPNGLTTFWYENGQKMLQGNKKDGNMDGLWTSWHKNGQKKFEANLKYGWKEGLKTNWYENGQKSSEGRYKDGKQDGLWIYYNEDGTERYRRTYDKEDIQDSPPTETIDLDDSEALGKIIPKAIDSWKLQKKTRGGQELFFAPDRQTSFSGWAKLMHKNGQVMALTQFKHGKRDGPHTVWNSSGFRSKEENYKGGKRNGLWISWLFKGRKHRQATYKAGKLDGPGTLWYGNGRKRLETNYKDGKLTTAVVWKINGAKCTESNFVNGNGVLVLYNGVGSEVDRITFKDGVEVEE